MTRHTFIFKVWSVRDYAYVQRTYTTAGATWEDCYSAALSRARAHGTVESMRLTDAAMPDGGR